MSDAESQEKRVLLMIDEASIGGGQKHLLDLVRHLNRSAFEPAVACEAEGFLVDQLRAEAVPVYPVELSNRPTRRGWESSLRAVRDFGPDLVHTHGGTAGVYGRLAAARMGVRSVHTYHGLHYLHFPKGFRRSIYLLIDRYLAKRTTQLICVAESDRRLAAAHGLAPADRTTVVRNGIDLKLFQEAASINNERRNRTQPDEITIGTVGRLHRQKGHRILIEAAKRVLDVDPRVRFVIAGDGEERGNLEQQIRRLGLEGKVDLIGASDRVEALLATFDLFVLPSLWEGLPLTLLEAMAAGLPIVATAVDGTIEVVRDGRECRLVPPERPDLLAQALKSLLDDPREAIRLARRATERVAETFSLDRMIRETEEVYAYALRSI